MCNRRRVQSVNAPMDRSLARENGLAALLSAIALALLLAGCATGGDVTRPVPVADFPARGTAHRTVVMLPGRGDDLKSMERRDVAKTIQDAWPDADVVLTGLTMPFYRQGQATRRLHDEIIEPVRARHHGPI